MRTNIRQDFRDLGLDFDDIDRRAIREQVLRARLAREMAEDDGEDEA